MPCRSIPIGLALCALLFAAPALCETPHEIGDRHEKGLTPSQSQALVASQGAVGGKALAACGASLPPPGAVKFSLVMRLDASGRIVQTWLEGEAPIAKCFQSKMAGQTLFTPPFAPFYTTFDMMLK